jgi:hypothetical protein
MDSDQTGYSDKPLGGASEDQTGFSDKRLGGASPEETREMLRDAPLAPPTAQQTAVPNPFQLPAGQTFSRGRSRWRWIAAGGVLILLTCCAVGVYLMIQLPRWKEEKAQERAKQKQEQAKKARERDEAAAAASRKRANGDMEGFLRSKVAVDEMDKLARESERKEAQTKEPGAFINMCGIPVLFLAILLGAGVLIAVFEKKRSLSGRSAVVVTGLTNKHIVCRFTVLKLLVVVSVIVAVTVLIGGAIALGRHSQ